MDESRRDMCIVAVGNTRLARCMSQATCFVLNYYTRSISHMRSEKDIIDSVIEYVAVG